MKVRALVVLGLIVASACTPSVNQEDQTQEKTRALDGLVSGDDALTKEQSGSSREPGGSSAPSLSGVSESQIPEGFGSPIQKPYDGHHENPRKTVAEGNYNRTTREEVRAWWPYGELLGLSDSNRGHEAIFGLPPETTNTRIGISTFRQYPPHTVDSAHEETIVEAGGMLLNLTRFPADSPEGSTPAGEKIAKQIVVRGKVAFLLESYKDGPPPSSPRNRWQMQGNQNERKIWWREVLPSGDIILWKARFSSVNASEAQSIAELESLVSY